MSYLSEVLADGPKQYWRCADPGGAILYDIGSVPVPLVAQFGGAGQGPSALQLGYTGPSSNGGSVFGAGNSYAQTEQQYAFATPYTLECWVCPFRTNNEWDLIDLAGAAGFRALLNLTNTGKPSFAPGAGGVLTSANVALRYQWLHLVAINTGAVTQIYENGVLTTAGGGGAVTLNCSRYVMGSSQALNANGLVGALAECAIYNVALTAARVLAHYNAMEQKTQKPVYRSTSTFSTSTGTSTDVPTLVADVTRYVSTTYQNAV